MLPDGIAAYLGSVVDGLAYSESTNEGNVFVDKLPASPARAVAVYTAEGPEPDSKLPYDPAEFEVVVRGAAADGYWARTMAEGIRVALHSLRHVILPDVTDLVYCLATQASPRYLGEDDEGRPSYSCTFRTEIRGTR